jgi:hypothetical protein
MNHSGVEFVVVFVILLVVILGVGFLARGGQASPIRRRRAREDPPPIVDATGPYEIPDEDAPSRSED